MSADKGDSNQIFKEDGQQLQSRKQRYRKSKRDSQISKISRTNAVEMSNGSALSNY